MEDSRGLCIWDQTDRIPPLLFPRWLVGYITQLGSRKDLRSCLHFDITENDSWQLLFQCCQNSFERTNSVFLSNPPFQKFPARFIKRMPKYPFFWENCVFPHHLGKCAKKNTWKIGILSKEPLIFHENFHFLPNSMYTFFSKRNNTLEKIFLRKKLNFFNFEKYSCLKIQ